MNEKNGAFMTGITPFSIFSTKPVGAARRKFTKVFQGGQRKCNIFGTFCKACKEKCATVS